MILKIRRPIFKLDPRLSPKVLFTVVKIFSLAVGKANLNGFDIKSQLANIPESDYTFGRREPSIERI